MGSFQKKLFRLVTMKKHKIINWIHVLDRQVKRSLPDNDSISSFELPNKTAGFIDWKWPIKI